MEEFAEGVEAPVDVATFLEGEAARDVKKND